MPGIETNWSSQPHLPRADAANYGDPRWSPMIRRSFDSGELPQADVLLSGTSLTVGRCRMDARHHCAGSVLTLVLTDAMDADQRRGAVRPVAADGVGNAVDSGSF